MSIIKINNPSGTSLSGVGQSGGGRKITGERGPAGGTFEPFRADRVQLSNLSAHLAAARGDSKEHIAKLSALTTALLHGQYKVDANVVSDSIIQHSLQFGGANYL